MTTPQVTVKPLHWQRTKDCRYKTGVRPYDFCAENYRISLKSYGWVIDDGACTFLWSTYQTFQEAALVAQDHWSSRVINAITAAIPRAVGGGDQMIDASMALPLIGGAA